MSTRTLQDVKALRNGHAILKRLAWLEGRLNWVGEFNRTELVGNFGISKQQASADIGLYRELAPTNLIFDHPAKAFLIGRDFVPLFDQDPMTWLRNNSLDAAHVGSIQLEDIRGFAQHVDSAIFRVITQCHKRKIPIRVSVVSLSTGSIRESTISPHAIISTAIRWHVRAWDAAKETFTDIPIGQIRTAKPEPAQNWVPHDADGSWNAVRSIELAPANGLSDVQRGAVEKAYGMHNGRLSIRCRECLVYYLLASMQLLSAVREYRGEALSPNLRICVTNYTDLLPLVATPKEKPKLQPPATHSDVSIARSMRNSYSYNSEDPTLNELFLVWVGTGLSKIAACYGAELCMENGKWALFETPLGYRHSHYPKHLPVLVTIAGKSPDSISTAKNMAGRSDDVGLVTCGSKSQCEQALANSNLHLMSGPFPDRDRRLVNFRAIIATALYVEKFVVTKMGAIDLPRLPTDEELTEIDEKSKRVVTNVTETPRWQKKQMVFLGSGWDSPIRSIWVSILAEGGIATPIWTDIKDYTHGDHRHASLNNDHIYFLIETEDNRKFCDIFYDRFSQLFHVEKIAIPTISSQSFWFNLFFAMHTAHYFSESLGFEGSRPPKNKLVHGWRDWGNLDL